MSVVCCDWVCGQCSSATQIDHQLSAFPFASTLCAQGTETESDSPSAAVATAHSAAAAAAQTQLYADDDMNGDGATEARDCADARAASESRGVVATLATTATMAARGVTTDSQTSEATRASAKCLAVLGDTQLATQTQLVQHSVPNAVVEEHFDMPPPLPQKQQQEQQQQKQCAQLFSQDADNDGEQESEDSCDRASLSADAKSATSAHSLAIVLPESVSMAPIGENGGDCSAPLAEINMTQSEADEADADVVVSDAPPRQSTPPPPASTFVSALSAVTAEPSAVKAACERQLTDEFGFDDMLVKRALACLPMEHSSVDQAVMWAVAFISDHDADLRKSERAWSVFLRSYLSSQEALPPPDEAPTAPTTATAAGMRKSMLSTSYSSTSSSSSSSSAGASDAGAEVKVRVSRSRKADTLAVEAPFQLVAAVATDAMPMRGARKRAALVAIAAEPELEPEAEEAPEVSIGAPSSRGRKGTVRPPSGSCAAFFHVPFVVTHTTSFEEICFVYSQQRPRLPSLPRLHRRCRRRSTCCLYHRLLRPLHPRPPRLPRRWSNVCWPRESHSATKFQTL